MWLSINKATEGENRAVICGNGIKAFAFSHLSSFGVVEKL